MYLSQSIVVVFLYPLNADIAFMDTVFIFDVVKTTLALFRPENLSDLNLAVLKD